MSELNTELLLHNYPGISDNDWCMAVTVWQNMPKFPDFGDISVKNYWIKKAGGNLKKAIWLYYKNWRSR